MDEFERIAAYLTPLADIDAALGLKDDAALLTPPPGNQLVITTDTLVEGVHFLGTETADLIARKLLRVNLSDLAAKGAKPWLYFLNTALPKEKDEKWLAAFAEGLRQDQEAFGIKLAGGDSTHIKGPSVFTVTAIGTTPANSMLKRSGAKPGDDVYVSGTIGDAALGLSQHEDVFLYQRYLIPEPRLALGKALRGIATACMDISDGLAQDAGHLARASGCGIKIGAEQLPLSLAAQEALEKDASLLEMIITGGDDYELLFTAPASKRTEVEALRAFTPVTRIGVMEASGDVVIEHQGNPLAFTHSGYKHFT